MIRNKSAFHYIQVTILGCLCTHISGMNVVRPYKFFFNPNPHYGTRVQAFVRLEHGFCAQGYNNCSCPCNITQIWQPEQSSISMLNGSGCCSSAGKKRIRIDAHDDGVRGHFDVCANLSVDAGCTFGVRTVLPHNILLGFYLPVFTMKFNNVSWKDRTLFQTTQDMRVHRYLTDNFAGTMQELDCLNIGSWRRPGFGDLALVADWLQDFVQARPVLRNVRVGARLGLTLPTGKRENLNELMAIPFGYNGTVSFIFGGGLNIALGSYLHVGFDVELRSIFGNSRVQRIVTDPGQTELLLLNKACVYTDYGIEQQYTLFGQLYDLIPHTTVQLAYQFFKRGDSSVSVYGRCYSTTMANYAERIQEHNWHEILLSATYDFGYLTRGHTRAVPSLSLYSEIPFKGKRVVVCPTVGIMLNVDF